MNTENEIKLVFHNRFTARTAFEMESGSRPWHIALLLTEGSFSCRIGDQDFDIQKDEITFFPKNTFFERRVTSPIGFHQFGFVFCSENTQPPVAGKLALPPHHIRSLAETLDRLSESSRSDTKMLYTRVLSHILFEHAVWDCPKQKSGAEQDPDVAYAVRYMTEHLQEPIRVEALARTLHISRIGLLGKFKKHMGCTLSDFLIGLRMRHAKYLLLESQARISEIAPLCGYQNAYYFSNAFKKAYGCSPTEYRQRKLCLTDSIQDGVSAESPMAESSSSDSM